MRRFTQEGRLILSGWKSSINNGGRKTAKPGHTLSQALQNLKNKKTLVFDKAFSILLLLTCENDIFQKEKNTHPDLRLVFVEKFSARSDELPNFAGGRKLLVIFGPFDPQNSVKEASENFGSMINFALFIEIYLCRGFHKFSPSRFSETLERGVPLRLSHIHARPHRSA